MSNFSGKLRQVGIGIESARGDAVSPGYWIKNLRVSHNDKRDYIKDESAMGIIAEAHDAVVAKEYGQGEIGGVLDATLAGYLFKNVLGSVASALASGESAVYEHTFSLLNSNTHPSLTIETKNPVEQMKFSLAMIESLKIKCEVGKWVEFTATYRSKKGATASNSPSYVDSYKFYSKMVTLKLASALAGLGAATAINIKSFEISFDQNLEDEDKLGDTQVNDINNTFLAIEGNIEGTFSADTLKTYFREGTTRALRLYIENPTTIGTAEKPSLQINLAKVAFEDFEESDDLGAITQQTLKFTGLYSTSDSSIGTVVLTNTKADYDS